MDGWCCARFLGVDQVLSTRPLVLRDRLANYLFFRQFIEMYLVHRTWHCQYISHACVGRRKIPRSSEHTRTVPKRNKVAEVA